MREALIILPRKYLSPTCYPWTQVLTPIDEIATTLTDRFGGCTISEAFGYWRDPAGQLIQEQVTTFTVAIPIPITHSSKSFLRTFCRNLAHKYNQQAVYLRMPSGRVEFISAGAPTHG